MELQEDVITWLKSQVFVIKLKLLSTGFRVFTFKNPYLGNTCVPFKHWTCSHKCGMALEEPAHRQERAQARQLELQYQQYIRSVQAQYHQGPPDKRGFRACVIM
ncbi:hypothetical protein J6590_001764 [Homalodisca vitripennis]|nr:hypothetical protein J6590_001764 [Homalodisca vitripennis]